MPYTPDPRDALPPWEMPTDPSLGRDDAQTRAVIPPLPQPVRTDGGGAPAPLKAREYPAPRRATPPPTPSVPPRSPEQPYPYRRWPWRRVVRYGLLVALAVIVVAGVLIGHRLYDFGNAVSNQGPLSSQTGYMNGSQRVNILVMGYGGGSHQGAYLTDSLMVMSLAPGDQATTLISVPRDLWVQVPPSSGQYAKINTAYVDGLSNGYNHMPAGRLAGGAEAAEKVSEVIGMPVNYWVTIDFSGFRGLVDALGGVDITVPTAFTARYPINDDPSINAGWKIIHFNTGAQHMNGEQAIEYARARYVLNPVSEGSDFARSARQQLLIRAILSRVKSVSAWPGLLGATDALQKSMYTNLSLADLAAFAQKMDFTHAARIGLTNQNVLVDAQSSDGQDILLPENGDWGAVKSYVAAHLAP